MSRGPAAWHLDKKRASGSPTHSILAILHHGKYQGAIMAKEKEFIGMARVMFWCLETISNSLSVAWPAIAACASTLEGTGQVLSCTVREVQCVPVISLASAALSLLFFPASGSISNIANSVYICKYEMQALHWPTVESATFRILRINIQHTKILTFYRFQLHSFQLHALLSGRNSAASLRDTALCLR